MKSVFKKSLNSLLSPFGIEVVRKGVVANPNYQHSMPSCAQRLKHAKSIGFNPRYVVDGGAYLGDWAKMAAALFPDSELLVIEPNPHVIATLSENLKHLGDRATIIDKALASEAGTQLFNIWGDPQAATSASLQHHVKGPSENAVMVQVDRLDNLLRRQSMQPNLVKPDLQGAEYSALLGAEEALKLAEMFIVEFGCLEAYVDRTTPRELIDIFYDNNFCLYDLVDCHYRPYDGALTGGDFMFVKKDSPLRKYRGWE